MITAVCEQDPASGCHELPQDLTHPCGVFTHHWKTEFGVQIVAFIHVQRRA